MLFVTSPTRDPPAKPRYASIAQAQGMEIWIYRFIAVQFICQAALIVESLGGIRTYLRLLAFASSLGMFVLLPTPSTRHHPARGLALCALGFMGTGLLHPTANILPGIAHWILNLAVWAPLFWVGRVTPTSRTLRNVLLMLWGFNLLSATVGVLQVYYPERFSPSGDFVRNLMGAFSEGLLIERADGKQVWRPFGLSDSPGGAAIAGSFAVIAGMFLMTARSGTMIRGLATIGIAIGVFCLYVCGVRVAIVITALSTIGLLIVQALQGRVTRAAGVVLIAPVVIIGAVAWTQAASGDRVTERVSTLSEGSTTSIYYKNRGKFIENSMLEELPKYPIGAGLGRYGMMLRYFGEKRLSIPPLWAEEQFTGWLYDGGVPMLVLAYGALAVTFVASFRIAMTRSLPVELRDGAALITALNIGWIAFTFNYPYFISQGGIIFWLLNALLFSCADSVRKRPIPPPQGAR